MKRLALALVTLAAPALALAEASTWNIDPAHSQTSFSVRHLVISNVRGEFRKTSGTVLLDEADLTRSSVAATIDASTVNTREEKRDADLRSSHFLDVEKYPAITFRSTRIEKDGDRYKVFGDLSLHGVTKPVVLDATLSPQITDPMGASRRGVSARTAISRKEFGITYGAIMEAGPAIGDEVKIEIDAEIVKAPPAKRTGA